MILAGAAPLTAARSCCCWTAFVGATFFDTQAGGSAVLWQHFFWIFGHPEVYILIIPASPAISEIIPVFSRKPISATGHGRSDSHDRRHQRKRLGASHVLGRHDVGGQYLLSPSRRCW